MRPFRFLGEATTEIVDGHRLGDDARRAERMGYSVLVIPDHLLEQLAPVPVLATIAAATERIRIGTFVFNNDLRHPAVLAQDLASLDVLSGGRLEIGIGDGWNRPEYDAIGLPFDPVGTRVSRLAESIAVLKGAFADGPFSFAGEHYTIVEHDGQPKPVQRPHPPLFLGGGGRRLLSLAGREADIVGLAPRLLAGDTGRQRSDPCSLTAAATAEKIGWIRDAAGPRFAGLELNTYPTGGPIVVTDHARAEAAARADRMRRRTGVEISAAELLESPHTFIGSIDGLARKFVELREQFGISSFMTGGIDELALGIDVLRRFGSASSDPSGHPVRVSGSEPMTGEIPIDGPCDEPVTGLEGLGGLFSPGRRALTAGLVMTITLVAFEALAISTVMPRVAAELGNLELYGWVFSAFFLASMVGIVVSGGWIDRGGLVQPMAAALGLFSIGLVIGGLAPSMPVLVCGRVLQGLGAGAIPPIAYVSIGRALPDQLRPRMFAVLSTAWVLPGIIGPALAGAVAVATSWRVVFLGLLPLIALAALITLPALARSVPPATEPATAGSRSEFGRRLGLALIVVLGAGALVAGLTSASLVPGVPLAIGGVALILPGFQRLTPPGTLRALPGLPAAVLLRGVLTFTFFAADAYVPLALQDWRGLSPAVAGLALTGATLSWTAGAWVQARRIADLGVRRLVRSGFLTVIVGIAGFAAVLAPSVPVAVGVLAWTVAGFGMGLSYSPLSLTVLREASPGAEGVATSGLQLSDVLGTALGTGIGGALIAFGAAAGAAPWVGLLGAFSVGASAGLLGFVLGARLRG